MNCPLKLNAPAKIRTDNECDPDCAWLMEHEGSSLHCAVAVMAASGTETMGFCPVNSTYMRVERGAL